jgi:hypothetical protein
MAGWIHQKLNQDGGVGLQSNASGFWRVSAKVK